MSRPNDKGSSIYIVDESRIISEHDLIIDRRSDLYDHVLIVNVAMSAVVTLVSSQKEKNEEELILMRLAVRGFNNGAASLRLIRSGYFQQASMLIRDLVESYFLFDLFNRDRANLSSWIKMDDKEREKEFKPVKVREKLDAIDGYKEKKRAEIYGMLSRYAAHVNPYSYVLISPSGMTEIGPFPNEDLLRATLEELAKYMPLFALSIDRLIEAEEPVVIKARDDLRLALNRWLGTYYGVTTNRDDGQS